MRAWTLLTTVMLSAVALTTGGCPPVRAEQPGSHAASTAHALRQAGAGQAAFVVLKRLVGKWEATRGNNKTIADNFLPFALGVAILAEEWVGATHLTQDWGVEGGPKGRGKVHLLCWSRYSQLRRKDVRGDTANLEYLPAARAAGDDPYTTFGNIQALREKIDQRVIGGIVNGWRGDPDFDGTAVHPRDLGLGSAWLYVDFEAGGWHQNENVS